MEACTDGAGNTDESARSSREKERSLCSCNELQKQHGRLEALQADNAALKARLDALERFLLSKEALAHGALAVRPCGPDPLTVVGFTPLVQQVDQLRGRLTRERLQVTLEIRDVLTPNQLARAAQIRHRLKEWRADMQTLAGVP